MTDSHLRILRMIANQRQRRLDAHNATVDAHDAADVTGDTASGGSRRSLEHAAGQTKANVAAAEARRRFPRPRRAR